MNKTASKKGFTLIELLVVIAIIALLLSILSPSLRKIMGTARSLSCRSSLRQLSIGFQTYYIDNDNKALVSGGGVYFWFIQIGPYLGDNAFCGFSCALAKQKGEETSFILFRLHNFRRTLWKAGQLCCFNKSVSQISHFVHKLQFLCLDECFFGGMIKGRVNYGEIQSGDNQDSDFGLDDRTNEFSRSNNSADEEDFLGIETPIELHDSIQGQEKVDPTKNQSLKES